MFALLREVGLQCLMVGTRTSYGVKTVEFTFEVKIVGLQASDYTLQNLVLIDLSSSLKHVLPRISMNWTASCRIWCAVTSFR